MKKTKILIVEDENIVANDIQSSLKNLGYIIPGIASSGAKAIEMAANYQPDLVLMDIMLKGDMTGIEAAEIIRNNHDIPIIFLTAYADYVTLNSAKITEPYGYIIKPFKEKDVQTTIEMALYKHDKDMAVKKERDLYHSIIENRESKDSIFVRADYRLNKVNFNDIYFIEALKDYVVINTTDNIFTTHATMKQMMKILPRKDFVRIHRSFIVRLDKIFSIKYPELVVEGKMKVLPVGGLYKKELNSRLETL